MHHEIKSKIMIPFYKKSSVLFCFGVISLAITFIQGCASVEPITAGAEDETRSDLAVMMDTSSVFNQSITGFMLYDPAADSTLYTQLDRKFLTPASNTKIYTFFSALNLLPEQVPGLKYIIRGDSLLFWGTGDPSFLHPDHADTTVYDFLKNRPETLYYSDSHYEDEYLGPGWSWADYNSYYSTEKSPFPIYGNVMRVEVERINQEIIRHTDGRPDVYPSLLSNHIIERNDNDDERLILRDRADNVFHYTPKADTSRFERDIPIHYQKELIVDLLADTLGKEVYTIDELPPYDAITLYTSPRDTLLKHMMQPSDNMIAEQLLLMIASQLDGPFESRTAIDHAESELFGFLPDEPEWADGSGLSRYNLFTPRSTVALLAELDRRYDDEYLFSFFPSGGVSGTISSWYSNPDGGDPFIYAKTGTLRHNHALSGYLRTRSDRKLIFSFMHNNYTISVNEIRREMQRVLYYIYETY